MWDGSTRAKFNVGNNKGNNKRVHVGRKRGYNQRTGCRNTARWGLCGESLLQQRLLPWEAENQE